MKTPCPASRKGRLRPATKKTVREAAEELIAGMRDGSIRSSRKRPYRPSPTRGYERALGLFPELRARAPERIVERLGDFQLAELGRNGVQDYVDRLVADGWTGSSIANQLDPLRVIYRRARRRDEVAHDPLEDLDVPDADGRRERAASPEEVERLLAELPDAERALWATYCYAGLRRGEARALRVRDVNLEARELQVERVWDDEEGELDGAKTDAGTRTVPIFAPLLDELREHLLRTGRRGRPDALVFGRDDQHPFEPSTSRRRALEAWGWAEEPNPTKGARPATVWVKARADALEPLAPHEARHTCGSIWIALGITNPKQICAWLGHASITTTFDRYGHLLEGAREQAIARADAAWDTRRARAAGALRVVE